VITSAQEPLLASEQDFLQEPLSSRLWIHVPHLLHGGQFCCKPVVSGRMWPTVHRSLRMEQAGLTCSFMQVTPGSMTVSRGRLLVSSISLSPGLEDEMFLPLMC
jgi:hypothetical protein